MIELCFRPQSGICHRLVYSLNTISTSTAQPVKLQATRTRFIDIATGPKRRASNRDFASKYEFQLWKPMKLGSREFEFYNLNTFEAPFAGVPGT
jgi:hypothetical protein